jgi:hypothetical protein
MQSETAKLRSVDESRKRVILIAASILAARKLAQYDGGKRVPHDERNRGRGTLGRRDYEGN